MDAGAGDANWADGGDEGDYDEGPILLDEETLAEMKDVFSLFDFEKNGTILAEDLGTALRGLGFNLTEEQIGDYVNENDSNGSGILDFNKFHSIVVNNQPMRGPSSEEEMIKHFDVFDIYRDGKVDAADLVYLLRELGEPLTMEDVNALLQEITIDGDKQVDIRDFVRHIVQTSMPN
jgi:Ca2+-binding EF-hand superfamily protein